MNFVLAESIEGDEGLIGVLFDNEPFKLLPPTADMFDVLVHAGVFPSKGQARKNWTRTTRGIPDGFTLLNHVGKRHIEIAIWKKF